MNLLSTIIALVTGIFIQKKRSSDIFQIIIGAFMFHYLIIIDSYYFSEIVFGTINPYIIFFVILLTALILVFFTFKKETKIIEPIQSGTMDKIPIVLITLSMLIFISIIIYGFFLPVIAEDDLQYHAIMFAEWPKSGLLGFSKIFYGCTHGTYAPAVIELLNFHLYSNQSVLLLMSFITLAAILTKLNKEKSVFTILALSSIIIFQKEYLLKQSFTQGGDIGLLLFFFLGIYYYLVEDFLLFAAAIGLLLGTKHVAIAYALVLICLYLWSSKSRLKHSLLLAGMFIATSGFWYIRNWIYTGNPVYPVKIDLFGFRIFDGILTSKTAWDPLSTMLNSINIWAGPEILIFLISIILLYKKGLITKKILPLLFIPFISIVIFFKIPVHSLNEHRFLFPALAILDIIILYAALNYKTMLYLVFAVQFIIAIPQWYSAITWYTGKISLEPKETILVNRYGDDARAWLYVSANCKKIATTGSNMVYHLFNKTYTNDVQYINPTKYDGKYLHEISRNAKITDHTDGDYPDYYYRTQFSQKKWEERIQEYAPDCLAIFRTSIISSSGTGTDRTIESVWLEQSNGINKMYQKTFANSKSEIWILSTRLQQHP